MPTILCPTCGHRTTVSAIPPGRVRCPKPACRAVFTPAEGTSAQPPAPALSEAAFFVRKADDPELVIGPLTSKRLDELINSGKFAPTDEFSPDRARWFQVSTRSDGPIQIDGEAFVPPPSADAAPPPKPAAPNPKPEDESIELAGEFAANAAAKQNATSPIQVGKLTAPSVAHLVRLASEAPRAVVAAKGWIGVFDLDSAEPISQWKFPDTKVSAVAIAPDGSSIVFARKESAGFLGRGARWQILFADVGADEDAVDLVGACPAEVIELAVLDDAGTIGAYCQGGLALVFPTEEEPLQFKAPGHVGRFAPGANRLATAGNNRLDLWDLETGDPVVAFSTASALNIADLAVSSDGQTLATCSGTPKAGAATRKAADNGSSLRLWDVASGAERLNLDGVGRLHDEGLHALAVSPDGQHALAASYDRKVSSWSLADGRPRDQCIKVEAPKKETENANPADPRPILQLALTADGRTALVLPAGSKHVQLWHLPVE